jgi:glucose-6-phosphate 1-dehydrogenase
MNQKEASTLVLFGARGNLAKVKLIPGLLKLDLANKLHPEMKILSIGRQEVSHDEWQKNIVDIVQDKFDKNIDPLVIERFLNRNYYHANLPEDTDAFKKMAERIIQENCSQNLAFFLSVRPSDFAKIVDQLADASLLDETNNWKRVLIEKPFGFDSASATELQSSIQKHLKESQIYRIDHYLGKFALQNILFTRFYNSFLEPIWNHNHIDHIQITNHETLGVGDRTTFYNATGALRDMMQSHILQILTLTAMEKPNSLSPEDVRSEKIKLLNSIKPVPINDFEKNVFRAQYTAGKTDKEGSVPGYIEELGDQSNVETYAAVKLFIENERWKNIPIYLRTAKRLHENATYISVKLKSDKIFTNEVSNNWIIISIQPKESIHIEMKTKIPGLDDTQTRKIQLEGGIRQSNDETIDSYEVLMLDLIEGNQSRFLHIDEVKAQWNFIDPIIEKWQESDIPVHEYSAGSNDPKSSKIIFENDDQFWRSSINIEN